VSFKNALAPMLVSDEGRLIVDKAVQSLKVEAPMLVMVEGMARDAKELQPLKR
jgi:hypothetical protein